MSPTQITDKLLSWATDLGENAREQAIRSSLLPIVHGHVALMPDAHFGLGATVGSVIPTKGAVIPAAVGVDIGCGMVAARLQFPPDANAGRSDLTSLDLPDNLDRLHSAISRAVPAGVGQGHRNPTVLRSHAPTAAWAKWPELAQTAGKQLGSLGSGNHFVEICLDEKDRVWVVLHSGSRGVGNKLATVHIDIARGLMKEWLIALPDRDLAYLVEGSPQFDEYIADMLWAQDYAMQNRTTMVSAVIAAVAGFLGTPVESVDVINCHHNFTQLERHNGDEVWLTRKGAIKAERGDRGVIPGSMGTRSYIVSGLGNAASYNSCSHGAGRRLGRKQAERELTYESLERAMRGKAWNHDKALLDEHPRAYKNIDEVMAAQADLVAIDHTLHQILNYKGT